MIDLFPQGEDTPNSLVQNPGQPVNALKLEPEKKLQTGRKRKFTAKEDLHLLQLVRFHGEANWSTIAALMPGRNRKQLRDHYVNFLRTGQTRAENFSPDEDIMIIQLVRAHGRAWNAIAGLMPGRSPLAIKNRYYAKLKRLGKLKQTTQSSPASTERSSVCSSAGSEDTEPRPKPIPRPIRVGKTLPRQMSCMELRRPPSLEQDQLVILKKQRNELEGALEVVTRTIEEIQMPAA